MGLLAGSAEAGLITVTTGSAAGKAVYDDVTNLTWLKDANLAATESFGVSGILTGAAQGAMTWVTAQSWITAMNAANYLGFNDWRLPTNAPINGSSYDATLSFDGTTDRGYNISAPGTLYAAATGSELAYMFYNNLSGVPWFDTSGATNTTYGLVNGTGPFTNLLSAPYASGTERDSRSVWAFYTQFGSQDFVDRTTNYLRVWAVRSGDAGDTGQVPLPGTSLLLGLGALALRSARRRSC